MKRVLAKLRAGREVVNGLPSGGRCGRSLSSAKKYCYCKFLAGVNRRPVRSSPGAPMSQFRVVREYPHSVAKVWRVLTDPELMPLWTSTGRGGRPEGFSPTVGTKFQFVAKPVAGWRGIV